MLIYFLNCQLLPLLIYKKVTQIKNMCSASPYHVSQVYMYTQVMHIYFYGLEIIKTISFMNEVSTTKKHFKLYQYSMIINYVSCYFR